jgi:hypothetical protein
LCAGTRPVENAPRCYNSLNTGIDERRVKFS